MGFTRDENNEKRCYFSVLSGAISRCESDP
ncbi:hypothetical protein B4U79_12876, partial [Dinothrombium tinctorium]